MIAIHATSMALDGAKDLRGNGFMVDNLLTSLITSIEVDPGIRARS